MVSTKASPRSVESHTHPKVPLSRKRMIKTRAKARAERAQQAVASKNNDPPHVTMQDGLSMLFKLREMERGGNMITTHHAPMAKKMPKIPKAPNNLPTQPKTPNTQQVPFTSCGPDCCMSHHPVASRIEFPSSSPEPPPTPPPTPPTKVPPTKVPQPQAP